MTRDCSIEIFYEDVTQNSIDHAKVKSAVNQVFNGENVEHGPINIIFCNDNYLHKLNLQYLDHNTLTDVITFDYHDVYNRTSGDIFVSIERVSENALSNKISFLHEIWRVVIHGVLHLCGYRDSTLEEKAQIRAKENFYLNLVI